MNFPCQCELCRPALLEFYRQYLKYCEGHDDATIVKAMQSQYRSGERACAILGEFARSIEHSRRLEKDEGRRIGKMIAAVNASVFCAKTLRTWNETVIGQSYLATICRGYLRQGHSKKGGGHVKSSKKLRCDMEHHT